MEFVNLEHIADILNGYNFKSSNYVNDGVRVIRITNVQQGYLEDKDPVFYEYTKDLDKYMLKENDLLMSLTGNVGRVGMLVPSLLPAGLNQRVACIRCKNDNFNIKFLFHFFNNELFRKNAISNSNGVAQLNLSTEWLKKVKIPAYDENKQYKIVEELDNIVDLIDNNQKQLTNLDNIVKSQFIEMFGTLKDMKTSNFKLKDVLVVNPKKDNLDDMLMVSFLPMEKVGVDGSIDTSVIKKYVDVKKGFNQIKENDVLFAKITPCMENGKSTIARNLKNGYACSTTELFCLRCFDIVVPEYIFSIVHSKEFRVEAEKNMTGSAGQKRVPKSFIEELPIIIPKKEEQLKFAAIVDQIDKSKFIVQKQIKLLEELLEKKMNEYFGN